MSTLYSSNFDADSTGALPAGWVATRGTWAVTANGAVTGNALANSSRVAGDFAVYTGAPAQAYQKLTVSQKMADQPVQNKDNNFGIALRTSSTGAGGYLWLLKSSTTTGNIDLLFYRINAANSYTQLSQLVAPITGVALGDVLVSECTSSGSVHEIRVWKSTGSRPTAATHTFTDATTASGYVGFYYSKGGSTTSTNVAAIDDMLYEDASAGGSVAALVSGIAASVSCGAVDAAATASGVASLVGVATAVQVGLVGAQGDVIAVATGAATAISVGAISASATAGAVSVSDPSVYWSPYNWVSDGAGAMQANNVKAGSATAWSCMRGAYLKFKATVGASGSISLAIDTSQLATVTAAGCPQLMWTVNGGPAQSRTLVAGDSAVSIASGLAAGTYEVFIGFRGVYITQDGGVGSTYNTPKNRVHITGIVLSAGGSLSAPTIKPKRAAIYGDSITEGDLSAGGPRSAASQDAFLTYGWMMGQALDAEVGIIAFYGQLFSHFAASWANHASGVSRLIGGQLSPAPDFVTIAYGENDGNPGPAAAAVTSALAAVAAAAPASKIALFVPFSGKARTNLSAATLPPNAVRIDLARYEMQPGNTVWSYDGQHPNARGHANLGALAAAAVAAAVPALAARTVSVTLTADGATPAGNLSGLRWAFFGSALAHALGQPAAQGASGVTDAAGLFSVAVNTALAPGAAGWLIVTNSDGTTSQSPGHKAFSGPVAVS